MKITLAKTPDISTATTAWARTTDGEIIVACGNGHRAFIPDHEINAEGAITPSLLCPEDGCNWHVFATLEGYAP